MNAKKIMGAVLVALLAAALFVGAGAAAGIANYNGQTVFVGEVLDSALAGVTLTNGDNKVTFISGTTGAYIEGPVVEGTYKYNDTVSIKVLYPTVLISAVAEKDGVEYNVAGATYYKTNVTLGFVSPAGEGLNVTDLLITNPDGSQIKFTQIFKDALGVTIENLSQVVGSNSNYNGYNGTFKLTPKEGATSPMGVVNDTKLIKKLFPVNGEYKIQGIFGQTGFAAGTPLVGKDILTFNVAGPKDVAITASVDSVLQGQKFSVTITGQPGESYELFYESDEVKIYSAGANSIDSNVFNMPTSGSITIYLIAEGDEEATIGVAEAIKTAADEEVTIEIQKATLTATLGAPSYFIGETIEVTLTTDGKLADSYVFNITGTNIEEFSIANSTKDGKNNVYELTIDKKLDVGTYTIKILDNKTLVATIPVVLKQPFISIAEAPEVVVQGKEAEFIINAEATDKIQYYIFGTNKFIAGNTTKKVKDTENQFIVTLTKYNTSAKNMSTGQYFAVFQHKMYDDMFNIYANGSQIVLNETGKTNVTLFNVSDRQTANAAQALCDALDSQNIDDMYVKASFFVVGKDESFTISEIPTTIAQGETLTISGVSSAAADEYVTVEMISTAFAAVPKETVGSAAFIAVTTQVAEDGTWEITLDTSDLNVDEYSLKVACGDDTWKSVTINVVEGADEPVTPEQPEEPEQPENPEEPVAPATPGFGALAALAGLGAVAVLLLRRE